MTSQLLNTARAIVNQWRGGYIPSSRMLNDLADAVDMMDNDLPPLPPAPTITIYSESHIPRRERE